MPPQTRLKPSQRSEVLGMLDANVPPKQFHEITKISVYTVDYTKRKRSEPGDDQDDLQRAGRSRKTSKQQDERLHRHLQRHNILTWLRSKK